MNRASLPTLVVVILASFLVLGCNSEIKIKGNGSQVEEGLCLQPYKSYSEWSAAQSFESSESAKNDDPDKDSMSNLMEYATCSNPLSSDVARLGQIIRTHNSGTYNLVLTYFTNVSATDLTYTVEESSDLSVWVSSNSLESTTCSSSEAGKVCLKLKNDITTATKQFFRVKINDNEANFVYTPIFGYWGKTALALSDTNLALTFAKEATFIGQVQSVGTDSFTFDGNPFSGMSLQFQEGTQNKKYYIQIRSGNLEGVSLPIVSNTSNTLTLDTSYEGEDLTSHTLGSINAGDEIAIRSYTQVQDLFGSNDSELIFDARPIAATDADGVIVLDQVTMDINKTRHESYFVDGDKWYNDTLAESPALTKLVLGEGFFIRRRNASNLLYVEVGQVWDTKFAMYVKGGGVRNDYNFSNPWPIDGFFSLFDPLSLNLATNLGGGINTGDMILRFNCSSSGYFPSSSQAFGYLEASNLGAYPDTFYDVNNLPTEIDMSVETLESGCFHMFRTSILGTGYTDGYSVMDRPF